MPKRTSCILAAVLVLPAAAVSAASFAVDDLGDAVDISIGDGVCATARGSCTLRAAVQEANALAGADEIRLGSGRHELTIAGTGENKAAKGDLDVTDQLTIAGTNAYLSVIDANGIDRVIDFAPGGTPRPLTLRDLTLTGGDVAGRGGALLYRREVRAERIIVTGNSADAGGGIGAATGGAPVLTLSASIVSLNAATEGGGIDLGASKAAEIDLAFVIANSATHRGGGINIATPAGDGVMRIKRTTVYGNNAGGRPTPRGGGIYAGAGLALEQSHVGHNLAGLWGATAPEATGLGGALFVGAGGGTVTNATIEGNLAADASAIGTQGDLAITHATIARNRSTWRGAVRQLDGGVASLMNTVIGENQPANCFGYPPPFVLFANVETGSGALPAPDSCQLGNSTYHVILAPLGYYGGPTRTMPPWRDLGWLVDQAFDANVALDQRGVARPQLAAPDVGAVELQERRLSPRYTGGFAANAHSCDLDRNGRVDFADLDRLIASFRVAGGAYRGKAPERLRECVASCTHAGCPAVGVIGKPG